VPNQTLTQNKACLDIFTRFVWISHLEVINHLLLLLLLHIQSDLSAWYQQQFGLDRVSFHPVAGQLFTNTVTVLLSSCGPCVLFRGTTVARLDICRQRKTQQQHINTLCHTSPAVLHGLVAMQPRSVARMGALPAIQSGGWPLSTVT